MIDRMPDPPAQPTPTGQREGSLARTTKTRRRLLAAIGVGGLATAAAVFGRSSVAFAANYQCCTLVYPPPSSNYIGYSNCVSYSNYPFSHYTWTCWGSGGFNCSCCEAKDYGQTFASGATCRYN